MRVMLWCIWCVCMWRRPRYHCLLSSSALVKLTLKVGCAVCPSWLHQFIVGWLEHKTEDCRSYAHDTLTRNQCQNWYQQTSTGFWCIWHAIWYRIFLVSVSGKQDVFSCQFLVRVTTCLESWKTWKCQGFWQLSGKCQGFLLRDAMQVRPMSSCGVCLSLRLSVCHVRELCQNK